MQQSLRASCTLQALSSPAQMAPVKELQPLDLSLSRPNFSCHTHNYCPIGLLCWYGVSITSPYRPTCILGSHAANVKDTRTAALHQGFSFDSSHNLSCPPSHKPSAFDLLTNYAVVLLDHLLSSSTRSSPLSNPLPHHGRISESVLTPSKNREASIDSTQSTTKSTRRWSACGPVKGAGNVEAENALKLSLLIYYGMKSVAAYASNAQLQPRPQVVQTSLQSPF